MNDIGNHIGGGKTPLPSPYHDGERAVQARAGARDLADRMARGLRSFMPDQHREFFAELPFVLVGSVDKRGRSWASILTGRPGFLHSPDPQALRIDAMPMASDPLTDSMRVGAPVGLLGIQLETRRRNRMNGHVTALDAGGFTVGVDLSFGNCPKYIQIRETELAPGRPDPVVAYETAALSPDARALIKRSDTLFIASAGPDSADVNHRGGMPGFVPIVEEVDGGVSLAFADLPGNNAFATFGNIAVNPSAGLLFVDFDSGDLLSLTGMAELLWDGEAAAAIRGAELALRFRPSEGIYVRAALPFRWSAPIPAPQFAGRTGRPAI